MNPRIAAYMEKIPALSPTITKILAVTGSDKSHSADLVQAIKLDPVLTAKVLNLINSAYFGMSSQITSINRAIILLGMNTIKNLALSTEVLSSFNPSKGSTFKVEKFWEHSLACAVCCKLIAQHIIQDPNVAESYFIAGLVHDIGKIFLIKHFSRDYFSMVKKIMDYDTLVVKEKRIFSVDHSEIGSLIAEKWALSPELVLSIRNHHDLYATSDSPMPPTVYLANICCKVHGYDDDIGIPLPPTLTDSQWRRIGLTQDAEAEILSSLPQKVEEAKIFLQINRTSA